MKRYLVAIVILTLAYTAYGIELKRVMAGKPKVVVTPTAKSYLLASYSTATEWEVRRVDDTSALTAGEYRTTATDGNRGVECYNTGDMNTTGFTSEKAGTFYYNQTLQKFRYWNGTDLADMDGGASSIADLTNWPDAVDDTEVGYLDGVTSGIQRQIDNLSIRVADLSAALAAAGIDTTPDVFTFTDQADVALSSVMTSVPITVTGISTATSVNVAGGSYDINGSGTFVTTAGTVNNNDTVRARHTSAASNATATSTTVTIGGLSDTFTSTTVNTPSIGLINTAVTGQLAGGQANVPSSSGSYFFYSQVQAAGSGTVNYAHWNTYSNGSTNRFHIYSVSGGTATALCSSATQTGTAAQPNVYDTPLAGCSVSEGTTYLVGVCVNSDTTAANGTYVANPSGIGSTRRVAVANCGDSFSTSDVTDTQLSTSRVVYAYGNNSATR